VVNIMEKPGAEVWGALYELPTALVNRPDGARSLVDRLEGHRTTSYPENYEKAEVIAELDGRSTRAWTYVGLAEAVERCECDYAASMCDTEYIDAVLDGAEAIGLPAAYVSALRRTLVRPTP
jgi:AIG2-like family